MIGYLAGRNVLILLCLTEMLIRPNYPNMEGRMEQCLIEKRFS